MRHIETKRWIGMVTSILFIVETLRALYMGDNYFETFSPEVGRLRNLQIVSQSARKLVMKYYI